MLWKATCGCNKGTFGLSLTSDEGFPYTDDKGGRRKFLLIFFFETLFFCDIMGKG
jgi:hypothetical protein